MAEYLSKEDINTGEYISRDEALKAMQYCCENCDNYNGAMCRACDHANAMDIISDMPAADVQPVRRGRWIDIYEYCKMNGYKPSGVAVYHWCSECMKGQEKTSDFCPCCGADMRGDENV